VPGPLRSQQAAAAARYQPQSMSSGQRAVCQTTGARHAIDGECCIQPDMHAFHTRCRAARSEQAKQRGRLATILQSTTKVATCTQPSAQQSQHA
jgi:hypothetical protein